MIIYILEGIKLTLCMINQFDQRQSVVINKVNSIAQSGLSCPKLERILSPKAQIVLPMHQLQIQHLNELHHQLVFVANERRAHFVSLILYLNGVSTTAYSVLFFEEGQGEVGVDGG